MASIGSFGWIVKIGGSAVSDVSPLDQDGKVDFKFFDRKAAMDVRIFGSSRVLGRRH